MQTLPPKCGLYYASSHDTAFELAKMMREKNIGLLPVVDGDQLCGVVSERDLVNRVLVEGTDPATVRASDIMTRKMIMADVKDSWDVILQKMRHIHARHVLITSDGILSGVLSIRDFLLAHFNIQQGAARNDAQEEEGWVDFLTDSPGTPADLNVWSCKSCRYLAFDADEPETCPSCGLSGTFVKDPQASPVPG